jgi:caffeoyl-CoA O-methyltransferase
MNKPFGNADPKLSDYVARVYAPEDEVLADIRTRSAAAKLPDIQVAALDALHLEVIARASGARRAVEIGTLGGYSGVALLRGMAPDGELDTIELSERHAAVAQESFGRAGFGKRVRIHIGAALDVLPKLAPRGPFDLVFIDADKEGYPAYLFGNLPDPPTGDRAAMIRAMQSVHEMLARSGRFRATVLPTGEGLAFGVRV